MTSLLADLISRPNTETRCARRCITRVAAGPLDVGICPFLDVPAWPHL